MLNIRIILSAPICSCLCISIVQWSTKRNFKILIHILFSFNFSNNSINLLTESLFTGDNLFDLSVQLLYINYLSGISSLNVCRYRKIVIVFCDFHDFVAVLILLIVRFPSFHLIFFLFFYINHPSFHVLLIVFLL